MIPKICKRAGKIFLLFNSCSTNQKVKMPFSFLCINPECGPEACAFRLTRAWLWVFFSWGGGNNFNSFVFLFLEELSQCTPFRPLGYCVSPSVFILGPQFSLCLRRQTWFPSDHTISVCSIVPCLHQHLNDTQTTESFILEQSRKAKLLVVQQERWSPRQPT